MFSGQGLVGARRKRKLLRICTNHERQTQYGLVVGRMFPIMNWAIKKRELTCRDKEEDRMKHVRVNIANIETVFLLTRIMRNWMLSLRNILHNSRNMILLAPSIGFNIDWVIDKEEDITAITKAFRGYAGFLYCLDGHHRSAAAAL